MALRPSIRFEIFKRDSFTCRYCGRKSPEAILEIDHILPKSADGSDEPKNLVTACYQCNRGKGARLLTDIPPEENLHEKTISIAEQELQIAEYNHWRGKQKEREDTEVHEIYKKWMRAWEQSYGENYWRTSDTRLFLKRLGFIEVQEVLEYVNDNAQARDGMGRAKSAWRMFCGICWHRIKNPRSEE